MHRQERILHVLRHAASADYSHAGRITASTREGAGIFYRTEGEQVYSRVLIVAEHPYTGSLGLYVNEELPAKRLPKSAKPF